ncbi:MAG: GGDEF domain-containing protein [Gemmatimonadaceae bacterium]|jgi:diguanylate cyclase (GGDEF)-like protein|nr:GGDEF domain-containing protein [Gemmatimonadaceae bacterium]
MEPSHAAVTPSPKPAGIDPRRWPRPMVVGVGLGVLAIIGAIDNASVMFSMAAFYLLPPAFVAWYAGRPLGFATGFVAGIVWGLASLAGRPVQPEAVIAAWNLAMFSASGVTSAWMAGTLRKTLYALQESLTREQELARVDALTGVRNLRAFRELLEPELLRVRRYQRPVTVAFLDADGFKHVNDTHGHAVGDRALKQIAQTLTGALRRTDIVARLGGDEFGVIFTDTGPADAERVLRKALVRLGEVMTNEGWPLTMSGGAVAVLRGSLSVDEVVHRADDLMFEMKRAGKNAITVEVLEGRFDVPTPVVGPPVA